MTTALGIDQATRSGWCHGGTKLPLDQWSTGVFKSPKRDEAGERLIIIEDSVASLISKFDPDIVVWEAPFNPVRELIEKVRKQAAAASRGAWNEVAIKEEVFGGYNVSTIELLAQIKGAVLMAAARAGKPTEGYAPRSWRSTLKLPRPPAGLITWQAKQKWTKQATLAWVRRMGGQVESEDAADAFGLVFHSLHGEPGARRAQGDLLALAEDYLRA
jgi:Holliday junction resolvasome RuvABC endonuclease subunit